uniref:Uncharacterized protein n=1 Tax=Candidatus Kentrum sp. SD TaxID=2126332 RepID=A0A451BHE8_9GAMM|nr:MAG: hypothetical protein BECKSD772D_GA0070982_100154 [Candidatus Kentron sp. SD]
MRGKGPDSFTLQRALNPWTRGVYEHAMYRLANSPPLASHPPHANPVLPMPLISGKALLLPRPVRRAIKNDEMPFLGTDPIHVIGGLLNPVPDGRLL